VINSTQPTPENFMPRAYYPHFVAYVPIMSPTVAGDTGPMAPRAYHAHLLRLAAEERQEAAQHCRNCRAVGLSPKLNERDNSHVWAHQRILRLLAPAVRANFTAAH
jgi:hypothetical protein